MKEERNARGETRGNCQKHQHRAVVVVEEEEAEFRAKKTQHFTLPCCCGRLDSFFRDFEQRFFLLVDWWFGRLFSGFGRKNSAVKIWPEKRGILAGELPKIGQLGNITSVKCVNNHELISIKEQLTVNLVLNQSDLTNGHLLGPTIKVQN